MKARKTKAVGKNKSVALKAQSLPEPPTRRRQWQWRSPVSGTIRTTHIVRTAQRLQLDGAIIYPISLESLRAWVGGQRKSDAFPVARAEMTAFGKSFLYPEGSDVLIAFWYDGRQRRDEERVWRARMEKYLATHQGETDGQINTSPRSSAE